MGLSVVGMWAVASVVGAAFPLTNLQDATDHAGPVDWLVGFTDPAADPFFGAQPCGPLTFFAPADVIWLPGSQSLVIADTLNRRVVFFDAPPGLLWGSSAEAVLGQPDLITGGANPLDPYGASNSPNPTHGCLAGVNACGVRRPFSLAADEANNRLFVADPDNRRVLVWDISSPTTGDPATFVLGQGVLTTDHLDYDCVSGTAGSVNACGVTYPVALAFDDAREWLFVADAGNNRVLIFDLSLGITSGMAATAVLGQHNLTRSTTNTACGGSGPRVTNACGLDFPGDLAYEASSKKLFVADFWNRRVLRFDLASMPSNGAAADIAIGQPDLASNSIDHACGGGSSTSACGLQDFGLGLAVSETSLYVADSGNHRVMEFPLAGMSSGDAATGVLGQSDFTSGYDSGDLALGGQTNRRRFVSPSGMHYDAVSDRLLLADTGNHRVMFFGANINGVAIEPTGDIETTDAVDNGDGTATLSIETTEGDDLSVTLPDGTTGLSSDAIEIDVDTIGGYPAVAIDADLPSGLTKSITIAAGIDICIVDRASASVGDLVSCASGNRVSVPSAGTCETEAVRGDLGDNPNDPLDPLGTHDVLLCSPPSGDALTISGLLHSAVGGQASSPFADADDGPLDGESDGAPRGTGCSAGVQTPAPAAAVIAILMLLGAARRSRRRLREI